jgi:hypothetical protein
MYLDEEYINTLKEYVKCKPEIKYLVLDNFLQTDKIEAMIVKHQELSFSPNALHYQTLKPLPLDIKKLYDANTIQMEHDPSLYYGAELFFSRYLHDYLADLVGVQLHENYETQVRLRSHEEYSNGFWIHTDIGHMNRSLVAMGYFNKM